ncbi:unnamed protein product [Paramecium octaurelia]|uniref:RING-type domain-containing protein n=1 Tax=Paramecium octaurelia TaxID=43137 RepID=A0A8S1TLT2_PAROT|nr:unnamed protein product [Paramecium octaurelia]
MQVKKKNIIIQEICPESYFNNQKLIIPIQELKPQKTYQQNPYQKQEQLIQQQNIGLKTFEQPKNTQQNLQYPIQQQTQIQRKDVPNQVEQIFLPINPNAQQKEVDSKRELNQLITSEQEKYKNDVKIYYNDLNYKQNLPFQSNNDQNQQYKQQIQKTIEQQAQIKAEQSKAKQYEKQQTQTNFVEQNQQYLNHGNPNIHSPNKKLIKIEQPNQEQQQQRNKNEERNQFLKYFMTQTTLNKYVGLRIVKQSSEERKKDNQSFREYDQINYYQKQTYDQMQFNRYQGQKYQPHQQGIQPYKPKIVEIQQNVELNHTNLRKQEFERGLILQQQQFFQQQLKKNSPQQQNKQRIQINEVKTQEPKNNQDIQPGQKQAYYNSKSNNNIKNTQQKVQYNQAKRQDFTNVNQTQVQIQQFNQIGRLRALSDLEQRRRFEYKPGMVITDEIVNLMTPEEIYEYFTYLDLENQIGLRSKIIVLENKRVQINTPDSCAICLEEIQPQKEAVDIKLDCNHQFHYVCIKQWLQKSKFCPVCKEQVNCGADQKIK